MTWRDHIKVHPAADLFPLMAEPELRELGEDIKRNGQRVPVVIWIEEDRTEWLLDGRNRLDAMELIGMELVGPKGWLQAYTYESDPLDRAAVGEPDLDPYAYAIALNIKRRHLTGEQKRDLIAKLLKARPERSNRQIAGIAKADHKTVAAVRQKQEATGEIPQFDKTVGADGKARTRDRHKPGHAKRGAAQILSVQGVLAKSLSDSSYAAAMSNWNHLSPEDARRFIENIRLHPKFPRDLFLPGPKLVK